MTQVIELVRLVSTSTDARAHHLANRLGMNLVTRSMCIVIYEKLVRTSSKKTMSIALHRAGYVKYFENTYLSGRMAIAERSKLVSAFFNAISRQYSQIIHRDLNAACYESLLDIASSVKGQKTHATCFDLGCGPATILRSHAAASIDSIIGYDFSAQMRRLAAQHGLAVMSPNEFWNPTRTFPVILSCYVLHYRTTSPEFLERVADHLSAGAVWVANFHKNIGLDDFLLLLAQTPRLALARAPIDSPYGTIIAVLRVA